MSYLPLPNFSKQETSLLLETNKVIAPLKDHGYFYSHLKSVSELFWHNRHADTTIAKSYLGLNQLSLLLLEQTPFFPLINKHL